MKKLLLLLLLCPILCLGQTHSSDPRSRDFEIFWQDSLSVNSVKMDKGVSLAGPNVICINGWYMNLHQHEYWLYISQYGLLFYVKAKNNERVNESLVRFVALLHDHFDWPINSHHY